MSQPYEAVVAELREARSLLETIANSTEHADAAQKWECEKAELLNGLKSLATCAGVWEPDMTTMLSRCCCCGTYKANKDHDSACHVGSAETLIAKYEAK
jgi:hypothetical protein